MDEQELASLRRRRILPLALFLGAFTSGMIAVMLLLPVWDTYFHRNADFDVSQLFPAVSFLVLWGILNYINYRLPRFFKCARGSLRDARQENGVIFTWALRGDPLGKRLGLTHCHRCNYERGAAMVCPECGAERVDPLPESTEP